MRVKRSPLSGTDRTSGPLRRSRNAVADTVSASARTPLCVKGVPVVLRTTSWLYAPTDSACARRVRSKRTRGYAKTYASLASSTLPVGTRGVAAFSGDGPVRAAQPTAIAATRHVESSFARDPRPAAPIPPPFERPTVTHRLRFVPRVPDASAGVPRLAPSSTREHE
jgi:hypothetical protein